MKQIREKRHRLPEEYYHGNVIIAFTLCTRNKTLSLTCEDIFSELERQLVTALNKFDCEAIIYLMMPDHCHLLVQGKSEASDALKAVKLFKQKTGYWFARNYPDIQWQKDFYDHILRKDEDIRKQVLYILDNPARKGLVANWWEFKFKGSTVYDFAEWT